MGWSMGVSKLYFSSAYVLQQRCVNKPFEGNALTLRVSLKMNSYYTRIGNTLGFTIQLCHKRTPRPQNSKEGVRESNFCSEQCFEVNGTWRHIHTQEKQNSTSQKTLQCASWFYSYMTGRWRPHMRNTANSAERCDAWRHNTLTQRKLLRRDSDYQTQNRNGNITALSYIKLASLSMLSTKVKDFILRNKTNKNQP